MRKDMKGKIIERLLEVKDSFFNLRRVKRGDEKPEESDLSKMAKAIEKREMRARKLKKAWFEGGIE